jgi:hypothetical protein
MLQQYFKSYYKEQHYSLSGYYNIKSILTLDEIFQLKEAREWLKFNQYYYKLSPSQDEAMVQIGTLCFGSQFIYRDNLKQSIIEHPTWTFSDSNGPIFNIYQTDFQGPAKKVKMLFISTENSKQDIMIEYFSNLYDGSEKDYPNDTMMVFIPLTKDVRYTPEYQTKLISNHEAYIGEEAAISIRGLRELNSKVKIVTGETITLHTLLKSLPASSGMSHPQLFQFIELNNAGTVIMGIYQACDQELVKQHADDIEQELWHIIAEGEASKIFIDELTGIEVGGTYKTKHRRIIVAQQPPITTLNHLEKVNRILYSPPKKHPNRNCTQNDIHQQHNSIQFSAKVTNPPNLNPQSQSLRRHDNSTMPTAPDPRFQAIDEHIAQQKEQNSIFHNRLLSLESTTNRTDNNIASILEKLEHISPHNLRCKGDNTIMQIDGQDETPDDHSFQHIWGNSQICMP